MPPNFPQQPQEMDERARRAQQQKAMGMQQGQQPMQGAPLPGQPKPLTNNYMGPPEAPAQAEEPARAGPTGFVGFGQQLAANQDVANRMAAQAGQAAMNGGGVSNLKTDAGRQALLQRAYGKAAQATDLDAALAGGAGGDYFGQLERDYGAGAQSRMSAFNKSGAARSAEMQARMNAEGQRLQREQKAAAEKRVQDEVARLRQQGESARRIRGSEVRSISPEEWAERNGMTLEEWVRNGKQPAY
jgi:hypothetical protein